MLIIFISCRQAADLFVPHYWMQDWGNSFWKYFIDLQNIVDMVGFDKHQSTISYWLKLEFVLK